MTEDDCRIPHSKTENLKIKGVTLQTLKSHARRDHHFEIKPKEKKGFLTNPHKCSFCSKSFSRSQTLVKHILKTHAAHIQQAQPQPHLHPQHQPQPKPQPKPQPHIQPKNQLQPQPHLQPQSQPPQPHLKASPYHQQPLHPQQELNLNELLGDNTVDYVNDIIANDGQGVNFQNSDWSLISSFIENDPVAIPDH